VVIVSCSLCSDSHIDEADGGKKKQETSDGDPPASPQRPLHLLYSQPPPAVLPATCCHALHRNEVPGSENGGKTRGCHTKGSESAPLIKAMGEVVLSAVVSVLSETMNGISDGNTATHHELPFRQRIGV